MSTITILGLGPGGARFLTAEALEHLQQISSLTLRTLIHPTTAELPAHLELRSYDELYECSNDFLAVYNSIAEDLVGRAAAGGDVSYAVPGHPLVAEATTRSIRELARQYGVGVRIIAGLSFLEPVCEALGFDPLEHGMQLVDALELASGAAFPEAEAPDERAWSELQGAGPYQPPVLPFPLRATHPAIVAQLYHRRVASAAKLALLERYPAEHPVTIVSAAGVADQQRLRTVPLHQLDHEAELDHLSVAFLPPLPVHEDLRSIDAIEWVVARLLGPRGCPWDREQTHLSLRPYLLEETYETLEALDAGDVAGLSEELGDLLLQVLMHSEMARQAGDFDFGDVTAGVASKLIRRHPHVFGDIAVTGSDEVLRNWDTIKAQEKADGGRPKRGLLDGVPPALPALAAAQKLGHKAAKAGFDWPDIDGVWAKIGEELDELRDAEPAGRAEELGDLLFVVSRLASWLDVDAETALREANTKFRRRFAACERLAGGRDLRELSAAELDALWQLAKQAELRMEN